MKLIAVLKKNESVMKMYKKYKNMKLKINAFSYNGKFENRSKNASTLCIVLAGYKPFLFEDIFERLEKFQKNAKKTTGPT